MNDVLIVLLTGLISPAVLLFLFKRFIGKHIDQYFNKNIEKLKSDLSLNNNKHSLVFQHIHIKKIESLKEIFASLKLLYVALYTYTNPVKNIQNMSSEEYENKLYQNYIDQFIKFRNIYFSNQIFLNKENCDRIDDIFKQIRDTEADYQEYNLLETLGIKGPELGASARKRLKATKNIQNEIDENIKNLREYFYTDFESFDIER